MKRPGPRPGPRRSPRLRLLLDWLPVAVAAVLAVAVYVFVPVAA